MTLTIWTEFLGKEHVPVVAMTTDATDARTRMIGAGIGILRGKRDETCLGGLQSSTADLGGRGGHYLLVVTLSECGIACGSKELRAKVGYNPKSSVDSALHENLIVGVEAEAKQAG
jgi:hypothetical protein